MSVKIVDKFGGNVIRKLFGGDKVFGYQTMPEDYDGRDISKIKIHSTLAEARSFIGMPSASVDSAKLTKPKADYAECQKGYRPNMASKKKSA